VAASAGRDKVKRERVAQEIENIGIRAEPFRARARDRGFDGRAVVG